MVRGDYGEIAGPRARTAVEERAAAFLRQVYWWMTLGLALTGIAAWAVVGVPALQRLILGNLWVFYGLIIAELVLVFTLSGRAMGMSVGKAGGIFLLYSVLTGLTLSVILLIYTASSVTQVFFITAATFAATSLWAYTTKRDLSSWGSFLFMGLIGIIIASVVNIFFRSEMIYWVTSYLGVAIFVGLTAYDTQRLTVMGAEGFGDEAAATKGAIVGALVLYLDFINLFIMLLRILGRRR